MKIKIDPSKKLTLYSQEFDEMRNNLDLTLQTTLKAMIAKNMDAAAIGLKINVELIKVDLADDNAPTGTRPAMKPEISARIVAAMQQRVDKKCNVIGRASKKEILIDDDGSPSLYVKCVLFPPSIKTTPLSFVPTQILPFPSSKIVRPLVSPSDVSRRLKTLPSYLMIPLYPPIHMKPSDEFIT